MGQPNGQPQGRSSASLLARLSRKKPLDPRTSTHLRRCLGLLDLTSLGVGSTLGLGLYVLAGNVASCKAGPAVLLSFALAALTSLFSALCYAEFAGRVPRAGSAYVYSYITAGELVAFVIGWNMVLEYVIAASAVTRGFSAYIKFVYTLLASAPSSALAGASIGPNSTAMNQCKAMAGAHDFAAAEVYLTKYFDPLSLIILFTITGLMLFGVKDSTRVAKAFTCVNLMIVVTIVCSGFKSLDWHNWRLDAREVPLGFGEGGFMPYGWSGVLAGAATCFFGFIGFDTIASSAEEASNPRRNVPISILLSLLISFLAYGAIATVQTLIWPYYDQNRDTILPYIFQQLGMPATYWLVTLGAIAGLASSELAGMYPLPRIIYSMANDRLIYKQLAHVNSRLQLPIRAILVGMSLVAALAVTLDTEDLTDMVSIGTLAAYSLVSLSVLILRYESSDATAGVNGNAQLDNLAVCLQLEPSKIGVLPPQSLPSRHTYGDLLQFWRRLGAQEPTERTSAQSKVLIFAIVSLSIAFDLIVYYAFAVSTALTPSLPVMALGGSVLTLLIGALVMLSRLPASRSLHLNESDDSFRVPWVPLVPTLSIVVNSFLMLSLNSLTWIRFLVWMSIGLFVYFTYGIRNSRGYLLAS